MEQTDYPPIQRFRIWSPEEKAYKYSGGTPMMLSQFFENTAHLYTYHKMPYERPVGLQDKNKVDLWENDIVKEMSCWGGQRPPAQRPKYPYYGVIEYGSFGDTACHNSYGFYVRCDKSIELWGWETPSITSDTMEVVGNTHANLELVELV